MSSPPAERVDVAVIGGGPAGLAAAAELARLGAGKVVVLERELEPGGIPRHAQHQGFGLRDLRRALSGPRYAAKRAELANAAGAEIRSGTQVTGWTPDGELEVTAPGGRQRIAARATVLATGCRERPRSARLVPGSRAQGVMTTGTLQQLVYLERERVGHRAVVIGAEHVSFSALLTLAHGGARAVAMTTEHPRHQSLAPFRLGAALRFRTPLLTRTALTAIRGRRRVEAVELTDLESGAIRTIECDLVVFTADWIPDHELAYAAGALLDPGTRGPAVDASLHTTRPGMFAAGNVLHGAETADVAALSGVHAAAAAARFLNGDAWPTAALPVRCEPPLGWIAPNLVITENGPSDPSRGRYLLRATEELRGAEVRFVQDGRELHRQRVRRLGPGRSASISPGWREEVDPAGGVVRVRAAEP